MRFQELLSPYKCLFFSVASTYEFPCSLSSTIIAVLDHFLLIGSCTETRWPGLNFVRSLGSVHLLLFLSDLLATSSRARMSISAFSAWAGSHEHFVDDCKRA